MELKSDHYQILGIPPHASKRDIKAAYRRLAKELHPDRNPSPSAEQVFKRINHAYEILKDDKKRRIYDAQHHMPAATGPGTSPDYHAKKYSAPEPADFSLFGDNDVARFAFMSVLTLLVIIAISGSWMLDWKFLFVFVPFTALVTYHFRDDIAYFVSVFTAKQLILVWLPVLILIFGLSYAQNYEVLIKADGETKAATSLIIAPFRLIFFISYLIGESSWHIALKGALALWFVSLAIREPKISAWIFFAVLFMITAIARCDTNTMQHFIPYYNDLFSIQSVAKPL